MRSPGNPVSSSSHILSLHPLLNLIRVGGRLQNSHLAYEGKHPIILHRKTRITRLLAEQVHIISKHAGPNTMMAILAANYHIVGVKQLIKDICQTCIRCQRAYAKAATQFMGQLPADRVNPAPQFSINGVDYAGPITCKRGNPRKPVYIKTYVCLFICFLSKAVHLELVSDLTTDGFLAAFSRFAARRGCPSKVWSDNGSNFIGAERELRAAQQLFNDKDVQNSVHKYASTHNISWSFSPSREPHQGCFWEAGVRGMKTLLRKIVGPQRLTYEELSTVLTKVEATMNSRPLINLDSATPDGSIILTPGHFLIGRPLRAPPMQVDSKSKITLLR